MADRERFTAIVKKFGEHYVALCLELNVASQGESLQEAKTNLQDAMSEYLEFLREKGEEKGSRPVDAEALREFLLGENDKVHIDDRFSVSENYSFEVSLNA
ncbi:MAG TPA: type II toxin-antitoxin system HicB family antitoxin [Bacteroidota bacterium]